MDFIEDFIKEYQNNPCLWNANSSDFKNKAKRQEAYMKLIDIASKHGEHYNIERTKQKINNLRCAFRHQLKKNSEVKRKTGRDEPYCPKRRYFESLMFLMEEENQKVEKSERDVADKISEENCSTLETNSGSEANRYTVSDVKLLTPSRKSLPKDTCLKETNTSENECKKNDSTIIRTIPESTQITNERPSINDNEASTDLNNVLNDLTWSEKPVGKFIFFDNQSRVEQQNPQIGINPTAEKIQKTSERQGSVSPSSHISNESAYPEQCLKVNCTSKTFQSLLTLACNNAEKTPDDNFTNFGKIVADKLRSLNPQQALFAEKLIYDVLFQGHLGLLSTSSIATFSISQ